ncbi:MAG: PorV/PorQ family protein [Bacteroidota bacterium]|nr:PorV/PorQ family protein [Bacteroidota bacterium]
MKKIYIVLSLLMTSFSVSSQNMDGPPRGGQYGFTQLLINGWGKSSGMGNSYSAGVSGVESFYLNIAGLGRIASTDIAFSRTSWLGGTGININTFGFGQKVGEDGVIGISVMSFALGQIPITTFDQPDGGIGTYRPSISNVNLAYAYNFSERISAGLNVKIASESTPDVRVGAMAFDAGLQYADQFVRGKKSQVKYQNPENNPAAARGSDIRFGVSIKNLGTDVRYTGDGLAAKSRIDGKSYEQTTSQRSDKTALPSQINIGLAYDFRLDKDSNSYWHRLTPAITFTNNVAMYNQTSLGVEYAYKELLLLRAGYNYEKGVFNYETRNNAYTGLNVGTSIQIPMSKKDSNGTRLNNSRFGIDYSYRFTRPFSGTHTFGIRVALD